MYEGTVLLTDDQPESLQAFGTALRDAGYRVALASDGGQCLKAARKIKPDLILLDIVMPGMDGMETCKRLKANPALRAIPVVFLSAHKTDAKQIVKGFEAGGADFVPKPFHVAELLARVRAHVELKRLRDGLEEKVLERTRELEESNVALNVLLRKMEKDRENSREEAVGDIQGAIRPFLDRLKQSDLRAEQREWVQCIESRIDEVASRFATVLSSAKFGLTPSEIQVARLIRDGGTSKEIARFLNISESVVGYHRENIRRKLHLTRRKVNLKAFLRALGDG